MFGEGAQTLVGESALSCIYGSTTIIPRQHYNGLTVDLYIVKLGAIEYYGGVLDMAVATDKERVSTYITADLKKKGEKLAEIQQRSLSSLLAHLLAEAVKEAESKGEKLN